MTDDAMNVAADTAAVSESPTPQVADTSAAVQETRSEPTARSAIDKAFAALEARDKQATDAPVVADPNAGRERNPDGTFKAAVVDPTKTAAPVTPVDPTKAVGFAEPPARFSPDAKAAWATAPEPVKAEITRAIKELETGIEQHRQSFEPYRAFDADLKQRGQSFQEVLDHYTGIEAKLAQDPLGGLDQICQNMGLSLKQVAAHVMNMPADQQATQQDGVIRELRSQIANLEKQIGGVSTTIKSQQEKAVLSEIETFASAPEHARFEELGTDIAFFLSNGRAKDLQEAYELADRLNPAPVQALAPAPAASAANPADPAQTRKGQLSTTGAPSSGSNPANRKPPASARESLDRAFANVGL